MSPPNKYLATINGGAKGAAYFWAASAEQALDEARTWALSRLRSSWDTAVLKVVNTINPADGACMLVHAAWSRVVRRAKL